MSADKCADKYQPTSEPPVIPRRRAMGRLARILGAGLGLGLGLAGHRGRYAFAKDRRPGPTSTPKPAPAEPIWIGHI
jgi:hypothetical protein